MGSHTCSGTDCPAQWNPHSRTHPANCDTDVTDVSKVTVAVPDWALAATSSTPGRRPSTESITASDEAHRRSPTYSVTVDAELLLPMSSSLGGYP